MTIESTAGTCVVVYAKDITKVAEFYRRTLNAVSVEETSGFVLLARVGIELSIVRVPREIGETIAIGSPPVPREDTPVKCSFLVPDLDAVRAAAIATGGGLGPRESAWSWRGLLHLDGFDPEGNVVQFRVAAA